MGASTDTIRGAVEARFEDATRFLEELIAIPSLSGREMTAMLLAERVFAEVCRVQRVPMDNSLRDDRDYSDPIPDIEYEGRFNLRCARAGVGGGRALLLNTHIDTVPPSQGQSNPYEAERRDGALYGRGACDAKGQVATIYLAMAALKTIGAAMPGDLIAHIVVEEEVGGNGTLAMVRHGERADGCVVLEPTEFRILTSIRGAVWFRITVRGRPGHSGMAGKTRSALKGAIRIVEILEGYHTRLLEESRGDPMFDKYPNPMPLTIGQFHAGNWPATTPGEATLAGVLGLLPNKTAAQVMAEMRHAIESEGGSEIASSFFMDFTYRHDASVIPSDHALAAGLEEALRASGREPIIDAMTASCDAWFYNNQLRIPTLVFGGGSLGVAHSNVEHMPIEDLACAAESLARLALRWWE